MDTARRATDDPRDDVRRPWLPACLVAHGLGVTSGPDSVERLRYVIVEEQVEGISVLTVSPWPAADGHGRLRFAETDAVEVGVPTAVLETALYAGWLDRAPHIGDVFAAPVIIDALATADAELARWLLGPVYDLTAEARTVAKLALYAVRSDLLSAQEVEANDMAVAAVREHAPAPRRAGLAGAGRHP